MSFAEDETESIYGQLSASERIGQVSISLDWNDLPADLMESLENLDKDNYHSIREKKETLNPRSSSKLQSVDRISRKANVKPYTFNNCHFHYEKPKDINLVEGTNNGGFLPDSKSNQRKTKIPSPNRKTLSSSAMSVSEFDHPMEQFEESAELIQKNRQSAASSLRPKTPSAFSQSIFSSVSKQIDEVDNRKTVISRAAREGIEREKQVIQTVHQELCELSRDLKSKSTRVQEESLALSKMKTSLNAEKAELERKEKALNADVQQLVNSALRKREIQIKADTEKIVSKYEDALEQLTKENKRLQTSLKDMVNTSRTLREQNKKVQAEIDQKDTKIDDLSTQLKQAKERAERLKMMSSPAPQQHDLTAIDLFAQMKRIANTQQLNTKKTLIASTQTTEDLFDIDKKIAELEYKVAISSNLIKYLLCQNTTQGSLMFYEAINGSFDYIRKECSNFGVCLEEYLNVIFRGLPSIPPADQHTLASHVYFTLSEMKHTSNVSSITDKAMVLLHIIPLYTISQPEVVDALLDGLLSLLSNSAFSRSCILEYGLDPIIEMLVVSPVVEHTATLASSVLVTLIAEGRTILLKLDGFSRVFKNIGTLARALGLEHSVKTIENLVVILQKLSKR